jgi:hypothetical protein
VVCRKRLTGLAVAVLGIASLGQAEDAPTSAPASTPPPAPLMAGLGAIGAGDLLGKANINIYGFAEVGYFYDASSPKTHDGPTYIGFNGFKNPAWVEVDQG